MYPSIHVATLPWAALVGIVLCHLHALVWNLLLPQEKNPAQLELDLLRLETRPMK